MIKDSEVNILEISKKNQERAFSIIQEIQIIESWNSYGAKVNLVGSLRTGLLMKNKDIDFHIYSDRFSIIDSFGAVALIANNPKIKRVSYTNLIDTEEKCLEWHMWGEKIMGIEIYQAVIRDGVKNYSDFVYWEKKQNQAGIIDWMP